MKIINFTAVEILPSLLDKSKTQTIRPNFYILNNLAQLNKLIINLNENLREKDLKKIIISRKFYDKVILKYFRPMQGRVNSLYGYPLEISEYQKQNIYSICEKPPSFRVKEQVKLIWNQRSSYPFFCKYCGIGKFSDRIDCIKCCKEGTFNKHLGTVEITEVFKIEIIKQGIIALRGGENTNEKTKNLFIRNPFLLSKDLAKRDGFNSTKQMFKYFNKNYDLSSAKQFYVYRWKWNTQEK